MDRQTKDSVRPRVIQKDREQNSQDPWGAFGNFAFNTEGKPTLQFQS